MTKKWMEGKENCLYVASDLLECAEGEPNTKQQQYQSKYLALQSTSMPTQGFKMLLLTDTDSENPHASNIVLWGRGENQNS